MKVLAIETNMVCYKDANCRAYNHYTARVIHTGELKDL